MTNATLNIGWATADITPDQPVSLAGQFHARVSEGVQDPVTATVLVLESTSGAGRHAVLVSCDLAVIPDTFRDAVRARAAEHIPGLEARNISLNATHTHSAPDLRYEDDPFRHGLRGAPSRYGLSAAEMGVMEARAYSEFAAARVAEAVAAAWEKRAPGGISYGLGYAVVGRNRRLSYKDGAARMYGKSNDPEFSHVEGYEDPAVNVLATYATDGTLTGLVVNVACPSQVSEQNYLVSADFWHDTRVELRQRLGQDLHVLVQCSAAGDQSPHILVNQRAEAHRLLLKGFLEATPETPDVNLGAPEALRRELAARIADGIQPLLPGMQRTVDWAPDFAHDVTTIQVSRRHLSEDDVRDAQTQAAEQEERYQALARALEEHPEQKQEARWYKDITRAYSRMRWFKGVAMRYALQQEHPRLPVEIAVLRLGAIAIATNPFEFYLDYGTQIKARSPAVLTFVVQLAGTGTYVPTARAMAGASYGAIPASNPVGPEGGQEVVEHTLRTLNRFWE